MFKLDSVIRPTTIAMQNVENAERQSVSEQSEPATPAFLPPIFILGMRPRTGTHFLANLLCQHPDCAKSVIAEDGFMIEADLLSKYVTRLNDQWTAIAGKPHMGYDELLYESIGQGLISFLNRVKQDSQTARFKQFGIEMTDEHANKRLVSKTPSISNLELFSKLFPQSHLLILTRDGRSVVESEVKSFQQNREGRIRAWARAQIQSFVTRGTNKYLKTNR